MEFFSIEKFTFSEWMIKLEIDRDIFFQNCSNGLIDIKEFHRLLVIAPLERSYIINP